MNALTWLKRATVTRMLVPKGYAASVRWIPSLGDIFPDFRADSTAGPIHFHQWAEGSWVYFFSHPAAFTPVCTTEIADVASCAGDLVMRQVKVLNIARDPLEVQNDWVRDIEAVYGHKVDFPMIADPDAAIARICGMVHRHEDAELTVRKSFLIDPALRIRWISEYPLGVGRDMEEVLRVIDALMATHGNDLVAPAAWRVGDPLLVGSAIGTDEALARFGRRLRMVRPYLRYLRG